MTTYSYDNSLEELIDAHSVGLTIELGDENNMSEGLSLVLGNHARYFRNKRGK